LGGVKKLFQFTLGFCLLVATVFPASATFSSLYIFGDGLSTTTDVNSPGTVLPTLYYGLRNSNGRIWIEVLAQRQGLTYDANNNKSYFDHNSSKTVADVFNFAAPPDVTNDLFVVWVCNADTYDAAQVPDTASQWIAAINQSQTNHLQIITNLYAKGVRTLILPNAVDISTIPAFNQDPSPGVMHNGCVAYNVAFSNTINQAKALCPGLKIYSPDFFTLLNNVLTNAVQYGLTNVLYGGFSIDAIEANNFYPNLPLAATNGFGTNFVFWDTQDPTAKLHAVMADIVQQLISPVQVAKITSLVGSNQLDIVNYPAGLNGFVDGLTNLALTNWSAKAGIASSNTTQSVFVPTSGPQQFYRLRFPYAWSWP
jgi:phospholipase/lecithinase/hemolysin